MIRKAKRQDIDQIMSIIQAIIKEMNAVENYQWDENYPQKEVFLRDIEYGNLYVDGDDISQIRGFICIDYKQPIEYANMSWTSDEKALVIHRMAVSSNYRGMGVAAKLLTFAEQTAISSKISYIRTDTYSTNRAMNTLFVKLKYEFIGTISMMSKPLKFNCYERKVNYEE